MKFNNHELIETIEKMVAFRLGRNERVTGIQRIPGRDEFFVTLKGGEAVYLSVREVMSAARSPMRKPAMPLATNETDHISFRGYEEQEKIPLYHEYRATGAYRPYPQEYPPESYKGEDLEHFYMEAKKEDGW